MSGPSTKSYNCATEPVPTSAPSAAHRACQTTSQTLMHKTNVGAKTSMTISSGSARSCSRDPSRPRRKKAKRACYACQRAHLTCGDERPCQRCIKRGLQDQCHDGVRKKAKYLHDAPNEALVPGAQGAANLFSQSSASHIPLMQAPATRPSSNVFPSTAMGFNGMYGQKAGQQPTNMVVPSSYDNGANNLNTRASVSPTFTLPSSASGTTATESTSTAATLSGLGDPGFNPAFFDPSHPALFNFDLASMNFDNHYGAMEFGILAHMTGTGNGSVNDGNVMSANDSVSTPRPHSTSTTVTTNATRLADPNHETSGSTCTVPSLDSPNDSGNMPYGAMFDGTSSLSTAGNWPAANGAASGLALGDLSDYKYAQPSETTTNAFVIGSTRTPSLTSDSPESDADTFIADHGEEVGSLPGCGGRDTERDTKEVRKPWTKPLRKRSSQGGVQNQSTNPRKRRRSPGQLYKSVKKPYSYTNGFHTLTAYIHKRFSPSKTLQIAKALASIRPSLIATNKTLDAADLVFMEKCFQRTLWEYEDFINVVGTPTIICRRTGEVAAVGEEFCMLTGWKKEILLGQDHNENVNMGGGSGNGRKSIRNNWPFRENNNNSNNNTAAAQLSADENQPRPVLLAELLDDESVIEFYDDFAKLAFGDSRGSIMATCKLLKYQTKNDIEAEKRQGSVNGEQWSDVQPRWAKKGIAGQQGLSRLGASDGKVECSYCWTVKRDVFDIPMLIVMNFLPSI